jgi:mannose-6-phosphate isomerase-like protein (cupin superfamily)
LTSTENQTPRTRHGFTRKGEGKIHETENYIYETLCNGIVNKKMIPIVTRIKSHSLEQFGEIMRHSGEEFFLVLEGTVELFTEHYASVKLAQGDCAYFDSSMGHACISADEKDAVILWVSTPD